MSARPAKPTTWSSPYKSVPIHPMDAGRRQVPQTSVDWEDFMPVPIFKGNEAVGEMAKRSAQAMGTAAAESAIAGGLLYGGRKAWKAYNGS